MSSPDSGPLGGARDRPHHPGGWNPDREFKPQGDKKLPRVEDIEGWAPGRPPGRATPGQHREPSSRGGTSGMMNEEIVAALSRIIEGIDEMQGLINNLDDQSMELLGIAHAVIGDRRNTDAQEGISLLTMFRETNLSDAMASLQGAMNRFEAYRSVQLG